MDPRFSKAKTDPRFKSLKRIRKKQTKTEDKRFANIEDNPAFQDIAAPVDKYGRLLPPAAGIPEEKLGQDAAIAMRRMVGMCLSESESESSDGDLDEARDQDVVASWGAGALAMNQDESVSETTATSRFAVVDMDWTKVTAADLLATFRSFTPGSSTSIIRVTVYLSDYGIERLPKEEEKGPSALGVFKDGETMESSDLDDKDVRRYEISKLRYYYAVVECESVAVAEQLVGELDGSEFETSQCILDLRYVPEEEVFDGRPVRDKAETVPSDFKPHFFECKALQKTKVGLTWDEDDERRTKIVRRRFTDEDLEEQDFKAYLASESETESDGEEKQRRGEQYAALLRDLDPKSRQKPTEAETTVSETDSDHVLQSAALLMKPRGKVQRDGKKIWDVYEKRRNGKISRQKRRGQFRVDGSASDSDSGLSPVEDEDGAFFERLDEEKDIEIELPTFERDSNPKPRSPKNGGSEKRRLQSNMELLMMDDRELHAARDGLEIQEGSQRKDMKERKKSRRARMKAKIAEKQRKKIAHNKNTFKVEVDDPRFSRLLETTDFAVDPTHPSFKRVTGADNILEEVRKKKKQRNR